MKIDSILTYIIIIIFSPLIGKLIKEIYDYVITINDYHEEPTLLSLIYHLTPKEFQIWCGEYLTYLGYSNIQIISNNDPNTNNIICCKDNETLYVQCTKYSINSCITINDIEKLVGAMISNNITKGLIISTGSFSNECKELLTKLNSKFQIDIICDEQFNFPYTKYILQNN